MRARSIKPGFFKNDTLGGLPPLTRILFEGLWCLSDRRGRLEDRPARIKAEILPYDNVNVEEALTSLHSHEFITRYEEGGSKFIQVNNFEKHQNPHVREPESTIPAPGEHSATPMLSTSPATLTPDSPLLTPDSSTLPRKRGGESNPDIKRLIDHYHAEFVRTRGQKPIIRRGASAEAAKTLLSGRGYTEAARLITMVLERPPKWNAENGLLRLEDMPGAVSKLLIRDALKQERQATCVQCHMVMSKDDLETSKYMCRECLLTSGEEGHDA